jgi:hypothetical protein
MADATKLAMADAIRFVKIGGSTDYELASNWLQWTGSGYQPVTSPPSTNDNVFIKPILDCVYESPTVDNLLTVADAVGSANSKNITISSGATLNFSNNNSHLHINGNYLNQGTVNYGTGRVKFIRNGTQSITDASGEAVFYQMNVGGLSLTVLNNHVRILHEVRLNGVIQTNVNRFYMNTPVSNHLVNFGGHVFGNLRRDIANNSDTYRFPMGVGTTLGTDRRLLEFLNNSINGVSYLDCIVSNTFKDPCPNCDSNLDPSKATTGLQQFNFVHNQGEWRLTPNSAPTSGNYGIRLYTNGFTDLADKDNKFAILKRPDFSATFFDFDSHYQTTSIPNVDLPGRVYNSGNGYAQTLGFTSFSQFVIASSLDVLPVELTSFLANCVSNEAHLTWNVASELNNNYYTLERSLNGVDFESITQVSGAGTVNFNSFYSFIDDRPYLGDSYYRLSQTDFDGSTEILSTVPFSNNCSDKVVVVELIPNPVNHTTSIYISLTQNLEANLAIYDKTGRLIMDVLKQKSLTKGSIEIKLDLEFISSGMYYLAGNVGSEIISTKIIKQ